MVMAPLVRIGLPQTGGALVAAARSGGYPVLFSASAFAASYPRDHERQGFFRRFRQPDATQLGGMDVALDSGGFVTAAHHGDYRWTVDEYLDLAASHPWTWWSALDMCCEPEIAGNRPLRILRLANTAHLLGRCRAGALERGMAAPMPILQGWTPDEYALCARWLPLLEWPDLVGIGSVCRRPLHGLTGLLAVLSAVDAILPPHVRLHLFGVKSGALQVLAGHPRLASVDSMAWDVAARVERRIGRTAAFRAGHMHAWAAKQLRAAERVRFGAGVVQALLFDPADAGGQARGEDLALEALALCYADLVISGDLEYRSAVVHCCRDEMTLIAMLRQGAAAEDLDEMFSGLGAEVERLREERGVR